MKFLKRKASKEANGNERVPVPQAQTSRSAGDVQGHTSHSLADLKMKLAICVGKLDTFEGHVGWPNNCLEEPSMWIKLDMIMLLLIIQIMNSLRQRRTVIYDVYMMFGGINRIQMLAELNELSANMNTQKAINVFMEVNDKLITLDLDTGACVTLVSEQTWKDKLESVNLSKTSLILTLYSMGYFKNTPAWGHYGPSPSNFVVSCPIMGVLIEFDKFSPK